MSPLLFALGVALAFPTPVAPLQRRGDASFAGLLVRDRTNITWLEQLVIAPGAKLTRATVTLGEWVHPAWQMAIAPCGRAERMAAEARWCDCTGNDMGLVIHPRLLRWYRSSVAQVRICRRPHA